MVFHLSSRQSEGLLRSLFALLKLDNDVPDHTTISRRKAKLGKVLKHPLISNVREDFGKGRLFEKHLAETLDQRS